VESVFRTKPHKPNRFLGTQGPGNLVRLHQRPTNLVRARISIKEAWVPTRSGVERKSGWGTLEPNKCACNLIQNQIMSSEIRGFDKILTNAS
jgi:hypothetical protein